MAMTCYEKNDYITSFDNKNMFRLKSSAEIKKGYFIVHAYDLINERECFLKFTGMDPERDEDRINLTRESKFKFFYPYIEQVYGLFTGLDPKGCPILGVSVEWIEGQDLSFARGILQNRIKVVKEKPDDLTEDEAERIIFRQIMQFLYGMNYYLRFTAPSYLHRDIRPRNIMIMNSDKGDGDVKIIDFDYAHISKSTDTQNLVGHNVAFSRGYTSPNVGEKANHNELPDEQDEIYSAGRVIYFWVHGKDYYKSSEYEGKTPAYFVDKKIGYGFDINRFNEKYRHAKYNKFIHILNRMCAEPGSKEQYHSIGEVIRDMKQFLIEYCGNSNKAYEELIQVNKMPLLQENTQYNKKARMVTYEVMDSFEGKIGKPLLEYTMRDILNMMIIYNMEGEIYYIPMKGTECFNRNKNSEFKIYDQDIFIQGETKIKFTIK